MFTNRDDGPNKECHFTDENLDNFRLNGFKVFPIPPGQKAADYRYEAANTKDGQSIAPGENYGVLPREGAGTLVLDFDSERFGKQLALYAEKYMVNKSPHGFHLPVKGISGDIKKSYLYEKDDDTKQIIDVQGPKNYVVGPGSVVDGVEYKNIGTNEIFDVRGTPFESLLDMVCSKFDVVGKKMDKSQHQHLRNKFKEGKIPQQGQSNEYFFQAALICNTEGNSREEAVERIRRVYDKWQESDSASTRPWSNIEQKINDVYDNKLTVHHGGHKKKQGPDTAEVVSEILEEYILYSDKRIDYVYEDRNGFLKESTNIIKNRIKDKYDLDMHPASEVMSLLVAKAPDMPEIDEELIIFKNGEYNWVKKIFSTERSGRLGIMGFEDYNFNEAPSCPQFDAFMKSTFPDETMRQQAYLAAACAAIPKHQIKLTMCYGGAGTGKSAYRGILTKVLGDYCEEVELSTMHKDQFALANWDNKTYISIAEAPKTITEFEKLKRITGEDTLKIRKMHNAPMSVPNYTKIIMDSNHLFKIPEDEAGPMFDRLHLLEFTEKFRGLSKEVESLAKIIVDIEGEDILSFLLQFDRDSVKYPTSKATKDRWEEIAFPEKALFKKMFAYSSGEAGMTLMEIKNALEAKEEGLEANTKLLKRMLSDNAYSISSGGVYKGIYIKETETGELEKYV